MERKKSILFFGVVWGVLFLSFFGNIFGVGLWREWFDGFQRDSSAIVEKTARCKEKSGYSGPLIVAKNEDYNSVMTTGGCDASLLKPYASQYGLQARIITALAPNDRAKLPVYFKKVNVVLSAAMAALMALVTLRVRKLFGLVAAAVFATLVAFSPWIVGYAQNMYWIEPLMFAPFAFAFLSYSYCKSSKKMWLFYLGETILLFLKLLGGYEYISTIAISVFVPIIFFELVNNKQKIIKLWKHAVMTGVVVVIAFVGAYVTNFMALADYYHSSDTALKMINERASERGLSGIRKMRTHAVGNLKMLLPESYKFVNRFINMDELAEDRGSTYQYLAINAGNYVLLPTLSLPLSIKGVFGEIVQSILVWVLVGYLVLFYLKRRHPSFKYYRSFLWSLHISLAGALSWLILMPGHALPHAHINGIVFYMPLLLFVYMVVGLYIGNIVKKRRKRA
ncbi:hypothetical protein FBF25_04430 [Candidatus Saccharibacteria bacterium oral taxon 488]|nr:hypothetical protein FBF25_04430 [Candidatus Saccharibacteria bacterium oral taxon 488]QLF52271.1 hypothetical protein HW277_04480 [Candidatus Saccharibacteria bacterium oral taxon 488]